MLSSKLTSRIMFKFRQSNIILNSDFEIVYESLGIIHKIEVIILKKQFRLKP